MDEATKAKIEQILSKYWYEAKTLGLVENALTALQEALGDEYLISYALPTSTNSLRFLFAKKKTPDSEYTVWIITMEPNKGISYDH